MITLTLDIWRKRAIVGHFVGGLLSTSYRTKSLGFLWALLDPLLFMVVYYIAFGYIIIQRPPSFMLQIFVGVIAFRFLNTSSTQAAGILRSQSGLIKEIRFPKAALPASVVLARLFDFGAGWLVALPLAIYFGYPPNVCWAFIPVIVLSQILFVTGISFLTAYVGVFFADIENILGVFLRLWFYMSPVLYTLSDIQARTAEQPILFKLYMLNPMANILAAYHGPVLEGRVPVGSYVAYGFAASLVVFLVGVYVFSRGEGQIGKYV